MHSKQALQPLLAAFAMLSMAQASWLKINGKFEGRAVVGEQVDDVIGRPGETGSTTSAKAGGQSTPTSEPTASAPSITTPSEVVVSTTTSAASAPATTSPSRPPPLSVPITTSSSPLAVETTTSPLVPPSTSSSFHWTPNSSSGSSPTSATPVVSTKVEILTSTLSNGSKAIVTTTTKTTSTPGLSSSEGETTGMTSKTRNTVIGVVVGVGGAIVLGALALVGWRIWGRKRHSEEHDVLMDYDMSTPGAAEKSERGSSAGGTQRTPFQSTLENYHQPKQVNPSSNF